MGASRERQRIMDLRQTMQTRCGRAVLRWVLLAGRPEGSSPCPLWQTFNSNAMEMARQEGDRRVRVSIWEDLSKHCPAELVLLQQEAMEP